MKAGLPGAFWIFLALVVFGFAAYFLIIYPDAHATDSSQSGNLRVDAIAQLPAAAEAVQSSSDENTIPSLSSPSNSMEESSQTTQPIPSAEGNQSTELKGEPAGGDRRIAEREIATPDSSMAEEPDARQPLAFAEDSPNPESSAEEVAEINALRQQFIKQIGGYDQDPSDPRYRERWQAAQQLLDEQLRSELGEEVLSRLQNESATAQLPRN